MQSYNHKVIERKWQKEWADQCIYRTTEDPERPKCYVLDMFPYPSGAGMHVGHPKGYVATDIYSRMKRMQGMNVLHPMGWDAFGLPAENYAIKNKLHPRASTDLNIQNFKRQLEIMGMNYDWEREVNTTDSSYYRWTQWIFLEMWKRGLAYESQEPINWCPSCKTGLANEDLEDGKCERCASEVEQRPMRQWVLRITNYADRLLEDLEELDWEENIKEMQRNWIGRSEGADISFPINGSAERLTIYTTRPDTIDGVTYMVVAPEHPVLDKLVGMILNKDEVLAYRDAAKKKAPLERVATQKRKTGIRVDGIEIENPYNNETIPLFIADYVMMDYGTGAIMAVPEHDERDRLFAEAMDIAFIARPLVLIDTVIERTGGTKVRRYKLRDWVFSRQRYWGEPIPLIHCEKCGVVAVPESELPVTLPSVASYEPTGTGESPLASIEEWVNVSCPKCKGKAKRETNTMPQWAGSCWYYLRYIDPKNSGALVDKKKESYWMAPLGVDMYVGGAEHATRHLIYARFWHKFLYDIGVVSSKEPFNKLWHVGLILAEDGRKMSKRWGNVVDPNDVIENVGADAFRTYEMFMGPFANEIPWSTDGTVGTRRFLERVWRISKRVEKGYSHSDLTRLVHKTTKKVTEDIENFRFNTAVSAMMILVNAMDESEHVSPENYRTLLQLLAPFAPHVTEELWGGLGENESIHRSSWPRYNPDVIEDKKVIIVIQIAGKVRCQISLPRDTAQTEVEKKVLAMPEAAKWLERTPPKRIIYVANKLINFVV